MRRHPLLLLLALATCVSLTPPAAAGSRPGMAERMSALMEAGFDVGAPRDLSKAERDRYTRWYDALEEGGVDAARAAGAKLRERAPGSWGEALEEGTDPAEEAAEAGGDALARSREALRRMMGGAAGGAPGTPGGLPGMPGGLPGMPGGSSKGGSGGMSGGMPKMPGGMPQGMPKGMPGLRGSMPEGMGPGATGGDPEAMARGMAEGMKKMFGGASGKPGAGGAGPYASMLQAYTRTLDAIEQRGVPVADLREEWAGLRGDVLELDRLTQQVMRSAFTGRPPPDSLTEELDAKGERLSPELEAFGERVQARAQRAFGPGAGPHSR